MSEQTLDELLERVARTLDELVPNDGLTFYEADVSARSLSPVFAIGTDAEAVLADEPFPFGAGITGWAAEHCEPVLANNAHLDPRVRWVEGTEVAPESVIVVPLVARGQLKGTLNIYRDGLRTFSEDEYALAKRYADAAALAIDNAHIRASLEYQAQTDSLTGLWNHRAFHERLRHAVLRASALHDQVGLVILDLDDFKKVNDVYGHGVGDQVLTEIGDILRSSVRGADAVCRIGGEEFAIILPSGTLETSLRLAERVARTVETTSFDPVGPMTVSVGVAIGPDHAANPRELVACAEVAMMSAKAQGKRRVIVFEDDAGDRPAPGLIDRREEFRSIAHLKMLHGVSSKLTRLNEVAEIGQTIADELRLLIDYHNCRVSVRDGDELRPIAFRGDLSSHPEVAMEILTTRVGVGITGHVAETGEPFLTGDAAKSAIGRPIEGTETIEESLLAVPLKYGHQVIGVIVVSKLGLDQFDTDDVRLLEVLAGHASVALMNAQLFEAQRREAETAKTLLELSREISSTTELSEVLDGIAVGCVADPGLAQGVRLAAHRRRPVRVRRRPRRRGRRAAGDGRHDRHGGAGAAPGSDRAVPDHAGRSVGDRRPRARRPASRCVRGGADLARQRRRRDLHLGRRRGRRSASASSACSPASPARRSSPSRTRRASTRSSARSSPPSRRSPTPSRRTTSTPRCTPARSATWRRRSARSWASTPRR